jgi:tRNA A37 threonylcarbamoyladenosine synthetase subunit TsaC/SUA5/YrdC
MTGMVDLKRPAKLFLENNVILFPTDTVVGL